MSTLLSEAPAGEYHAALSRYAHVKRFYERWVADPEFRRELGGDADGTLARHGLRVRADEVRGLVDGDPEPCPAAREMWEIVGRKMAFIQNFYGAEACPDDPRVVAWRRRQIERQRLDLGPFLAASNIHASLAVELTKGCSVGCWFCALSPDSLTGVFSYDEANARLWRETVAAFAERLGPGIRSGFLYWASDPLDNPDYERFCLDFHRLTGVFPPTTTALALKDPARTRGLLALAREHDCWLNRFSVVTVALLDRVHAEFGADELALIECMPLNMQAAFVYGNAGRFRERVKQHPRLLDTQREKLKMAPWFSGDPAYADSESYANGSIGCVTGFLVNMVERKVELISPCTADDRWPLGYIVFDSGTFEDGATLGALLDRLIAAHMRTEVDPDAVMRFHPHLAFTPSPDGYTLEGRFRQRVAVEADERGRTIGELVRAGGWTARRIADAVGGPPEETMRHLDSLLARGVLEEPHDD
jgi:radical SAM family RiPP maturation amino acid epimerase